ncbi:MAG TPA: L-seryl-tRNA(Sec) selenium transferase [Candidatus Baltobacteraceae bacterium]|nr:L-seryl-tRNA(Sec) selenium transferase [Candidatus Baltobacteraceae bacterium]
MSLSNDPELVEGSTNQTVRGIPPVHRFLSEPRIEAYEALLGRELVKRCIGETLGQARLDYARRPSIPQDDSGPPQDDTARIFDSLCGEVLEKLERSAFDLLVPVINGTGILLHTNLGRAPLAASAFEAMHAAGSGYSNLEYDIAEGRRGSRYARATSLLQSLTGAQDALIVNNCAAAVLLILDTFARDREVVVSRNQLIEIGGGFRLPDVLKRSGARLVEVGATNKVYLKDYERALTPDTALLLRSHPSNYRIVGFTHDVEGRELVGLGKRAGIPVVEDLGSGALVDLAEYALPHERTVQEAVAEGIDLVAFSADKMLGGPQAGIIVGSSVLIARLRANPLLRALRVDKLTLAALAQTLRLYMTPQTRAHIPFFAMLGASLDELRSRAQRYVGALPSAAIVDSSAYVGGGSLPESAVPSIAVAIEPPRGAESAAQELRRSRMPIIGRIDQDRLLLDLRTVFPSQDDEVMSALRRI